MNNAVFGKTSVNLRNRLRVEVITKRNVAKFMKTWLLYKQQCPI